MRKLCLTYHAERRPSIYVGRAHYWSGDYVRCARVEDNQSWMYAFCNRGDISIRGTTGINPLFMMSMTVCCRNPGFGKVHGSCKTRPSSCRLKMTY